MRGGGRGWCLREKTASAIRERVQHAREERRARFRSNAKVNCNVRMGLRQIKRHRQLSDESRELIRVVSLRLLTAYT
jgi:predicted ATPase with chaperone activity